MDERLQQQHAETVERFEQRFGHRPRFGAAAPGRVNLIGEHTDYNDGFVLPMAIERRTLCLARPLDEPRVEVVSEPGDGEGAHLPAEQTRIALDQPLKPEAPDWANYVRGILAGWQQTVGELPGFELLIRSDVPRGGGVSSSAALEVATATLLEALTGHSMAPMDKALLCQRAEHEFAGMPCGLMDQFISVHAEPGQALLLDCQSRAYEAVALDDPDVVVLVINSRVKHELVEGAYKQRREQCEAAAKHLGVTSLRVAGYDRVIQAKPDLPAAVFKRALHVVTENARTERAAGLMRAGDWAGAGRLMRDSHESLRYQFEVSCRELDLLVEMADRFVNQGVYGSRMTGGGFGGCTVTLLRADAVEPLSRFVAEHYPKHTGLDPVIFATRPAAGAMGLPIE